MRKPPTLFEVDWQKRIDEAAYTILRCWGHWEEQAGEAETSAQNPAAYEDEMLGQLSAVLEGLVFDPDTER